MHLELGPQNLRAELRGEDKTVAFETTDMTVSYREAAAVFYINLGERLGRKEALEFLEGLYSAIGKSPYKVEKNDIQIMQTDGKRFEASIASTEWGGNRMNKNKTMHRIAAELEAFKSAIDAKYAKPPLGLKRA